MNLRRGVLAAALVVLLVAGCSTVVDGRGVIATPRPGTPIDWSQFAAPAVFGVAMRVYASSRLTSAAPVHNLVVSNVPGPQVPLYFLGAQVNAMYPLGPIFHGSGLNITVMSLNGTLDVGLISCPELLPDLWDMADDFEAALKELLDATR